jgi:hypothetical protein
MQYLYELDQTQTTFGVLENQTRPNFNFKTLQDWADQTGDNGVTLDRHSVYKLAGELDQDVIDRIDYAFDDWGKKKIKYAQVCAEGGARRRLFCRAMSFRVLPQLAIGDEDPRFGRFSPEVVDLRLKGRTIPGFRFLCALESDDHEPLGWSSIERCYFVGANNVLPAERIARWHRFGQNLSESVLVGDLTYIDNSVSSRRFTLRIEPIDGGGSDCDTREHCQSQCDKPIHDTLLMICLSESRSG